MLDLYNNSTFSLQVGGLLTMVMKKDGLPPATWRERKKKKSSPTWVEKAP